MSKQPKPFTKSLRRKNAKLHQALRNVQDAVDALNEAAASARDWSDYETVKYFQHQLEEFLSCDHGEAGFEPYLKAEANRL